MTFDFSATPDLDEVLHTPSPHAGEDGFYATMSEMLEDRLAHSPRLVVDSVDEFFALLNLSDLP